MSIGINLHTSDSVPQFGCLTFFNLYFQNQLDDSKFVWVESTFRFTSKDHTTGYFKFADLNKVFDPTYGFLVDELLNIQAQVRIFHESFSHDRPNSNVLLTSKINWTINNFHFFQNVMKSKSNRIISSSFLIGCVEYQLCVWVTLVWRSWVCIWCLVRVGM